MDVRLALTGFGNVGQGLAVLLERYGLEYQRRYGVRLLLSGVVDRTGAAINRDGLDLAALVSSKSTTGSVAAQSDGIEGLRGDAFLDAADAQVLVEAASTNFVDAEPGWSYVQSALHRRRDVVLASKGSLALHWDELMALSRQAERQVLFSATVGAPVPALQVAERVLVGATIKGFEGILNATTHQILTAMNEGVFLRGRRPPGARTRNRGDRSDP